MKIFKLILLSTALAVSACNAETQSSAKTQSDIATLEYPTTIAPDLADRFSALALTCVHQEFPNKISRTTATAEEIGRPKKIFPAFYGCFDWHSSVHGHWLLVRLLRVGPQDAAWRDEAIAKLNQSFTAENIAGEVTNYNRPEGGSWERPYGLAWYLQLTAELRDWAKQNDDPQAKEWLKILEPLETDIAGGLNRGSLSSPIPYVWVPIIRALLLLASCSIGRGLRAIPKWNDLSSSGLRLFIWGIKIVHLPMNRVVKTFSRPA